MGSAKGAVKVHTDIVHSSQVNNIANSLLSVLVLPLLRRTAREHPSPTFKPHLTIVTSGAHYWINDLLPGMNQGRTDILQCFQEQDLFDAAQRYPESKGEASSAAALDLRKISLIECPPSLVLTFSRQRTRLLEAQ